MFPLLQKGEMEGILITVIFRLLFSRNGEQISWTPAATGPMELLCSQHRFSRGFTELMGQVRVLDAKQIKWLQPETERDMAEGRSWPDIVYRRRDASVLVSFPAAAASPSPMPGYYHLLYQGRGETQVTWHGETYCLVGGYRAYGDAPIATPAKVEAEKPVPRRAPKRHQTSRESDEELGCPTTTKIQWLQHSDKRLNPRKLADRATSHLPDGI